MKGFHFFPRLSLHLFFLALPSVILSQPAKVSTTGNNSPAVVAANIKIKYGVNTEVVIELLKIYEGQGLSLEARNRKAVKLIENYKKISPKEELSISKKQALGIENDKKVINALNWDIYLSTRGENSPAIYSKGGNVGIWYGIEPEAFKGIYEVLRKNASKIDLLEDKLAEQVKSYKELKEELLVRRSSDLVAEKALIVLEQGKLDSAIAILEKDIDSDNKKTAYRNYLLGKTYYLKLDYNKAGNYLRIAQSIDPQSIKYTVDYAGSLSQTGNYRTAIDYLKAALQLTKDDSVKADIYAKTGVAFYILDEPDSALFYHTKSLEINTRLFGNEDPAAAQDYSNIGLVYADRGDFKNAFSYLFKALIINATAYGASMLVVTNYNNLAGAYSKEGNSLLSGDKIGLAIEYLEKALSMEMQIDSTESPSVAVLYSNLARNYSRLGDAKKAYEYDIRSLNINLRYYGGQHPKIAVNYNNLGMTLRSMNDPIAALSYFHKSLNISGRIFEKDHYHIIALYHNMALAYSDNSQHDSAMFFFDKSIELNIKKYGAECERVGQAYINVGDLYKQKKEYSKSLEYYSKSRTILLKYYSPNSNIIKALNKEFE